MSNLDVIICTLPMDHLEKLKPQVHNRFRSSDARSAWLSWVDAIATGSPGAFSGGNFGGLAAPASDANAVHRGQPWGVVHAIAPHLSRFPAVSRSDRYLGISPAMAELLQYMFSMFDVQLGQALDVVRVCTMCLPTPVPMWSGSTLPSHLCMVALN